MSVTIRLDFRPLLGAVRDQGARPTCLAHAATTAHEHARGSKAALSPEYLHYFASTNDSSPEGVDFPNVSRALLGPGQPAETDCPYHHNEPQPTWAPPTNVLLYRRRSTSPKQSPDEVEALLDVGPCPSSGYFDDGRFLLSCAAMGHLSNRPGSRPPRGRGGRTRNDVHNAPLPHPE